MITMLSRTPAPKADRPPRYFEAFGDALAETLFLRNAVLLLAGLCLALTIGLVRLAQRPPLVIRVDDLGDPVIFANTPVQNAVSGPEVRNFAEHFTRYALAWDLYTLDHDVDTALAMMTQSGAQKMVRALDAMGASTFAKEHSVRTTVDIAEVSVVKDTPSTVEVKVRGTRTYLSYSDKDFKKQTTFEDSFVARKVSRAQSPWGLLIEEWQEAVFN